MYNRDLKDCLAFQESSMAINVLVMRVNQAQKVKVTVNNLQLSIAPPGPGGLEGEIQRKICKVASLENTNHLLLLLKFTLESE